MHLDHKNVNEQSVDAYLAAAASFKIIWKQVGFYSFHYN